MARPPPVDRQLNYTPAGGIYPAGIITFKYADTDKRVATASVQTFGPTTALTTQASIVVSMLSAGTYHI